MVVFRLNVRDFYLSLIFLVLIVCIKIWNYNYCGKVGDMKERQKKLTNTMQIDGRDSNKGNLMKAVMGYIVSLVVYIIM